MTRQQARADISLFRHDLRSHVFDLSTHSLRNKCIEFLDSLLENLFDTSESPKAMELIRVAEVVDESLPKNLVTRRQYQLFAAQLRTEAGKKQSVNSPWRGKGIPENLTPQQMQILEVLWKLNLTQSLAWTIEMDAFTLAVWGDEEISPGTVRTALSRFRTALWSKGFKLDVYPRFATARPYVDCKFLS